MAPSNHGAQASTMICSKNSMRIITAPEPTTTTQASPAAGGASLKRRRASQNMPAPSNTTCSATRNNQARWTPIPDQAKGHFRG